ncbi:energy-coupled thiamine transporter ThiT [Oceanobacillus oncorhynchi]|uniref:energy-coupled thiamine transporter ThiT n=1 Tax=Oceanobacillus sp. FSL K6-0251 TaxID=2921602 RepID=UPI0005AC4599|nr:energy-coupled thiamine transporter ThiT [Oceanobacillus oncorhynchi]MDM8100547.1 energy-coupled thiamine transporter ThiT [Oceanobacillus oncorhynchi]UUI38313.1 energy-coupled thiamine transporter ThiT [Oceanobacillus oncorhynchi]
MGERRLKNKTLFLVEVAIFTALALLLDILPLGFKLWPQGGSVSFAMIPVFIVAFRWGLKGGLLSGFLWGILQVATGTAYILHPVQGIIEYGLAFTVVGLAGVFSKQVIESMKNKRVKKSFVYISVGVFLGSAARFICHYIAGMVFFGSAVEGQPAWLYSLIYNSSYMVPSFILSLVIVFLLFYKQPRTLVGKV